MITEYFHWGVLKICLFLCFQLPTISAYAHSACEGLGSVSQEVLASARNGSSRSFQTLLRQIKCLDGGELEDAYIGIGEALFSNPKKFSPYVRASGGLSPNDVSSISGMLPSKFVDAPCAQVSELERRAVIIQDSNLFEAKLRPALIKSIEQGITETRSWCERTKNK